MAPDLLPSGLVISALAPDAHGTITVHQNAKRLQLPADTKKEQQTMAPALALTADPTAVFSGHIVGQTTKKKTVSAQPPIDPPARPPIDLSKVIDLSVDTDQSVDSQEHAKNSVL